MNFPTLPGGRLPKALTIEEVDRRIRVWHDMDAEDYEALGRPGLEEFLGWTWDEYSYWVMYNVLPTT